MVAVALFCGDTVASEASWASLRYLLAAPVPRARLLRQKLIVALGYSAVAVVSFPAMALLAGTVAFGWHPLQLPATGMELALRHGTGADGDHPRAMSSSPSWWWPGSPSCSRCRTDSPLGAVGGAVGLVIVSNILDAVTALGSWREILPTHWQFAWLDAFSAAAVLGRR